jgi:hypothetical protein
MNSGSVIVPIETLRRLSRLAPLAGALALLYICLGAVVAYAAYLDLGQSLERQRERIPYAAVMYISFELLLVLSTFRTWQVGIRLHQLRSEPSSAHLEGALAKTRDMLLLFFVWLIISLGFFLWSMFQPIY